MTSAQTSQELGQGHDGTGAATGNLDPESLLDIFKGIEVDENPIRLLSRDLADIDIHSLLEQMRRLAKEMRLTH